MLTEIIIIGSLIVFIAAIWFEFYRLRKLKHTFIGSKLISDLKLVGFQEIKPRSLSKKYEGYESWLRWHTNSGRIELAIGIAFKTDFSKKESSFKYAMQFFRIYRDEGFNISGKRGILKEYMSPV